MKDRRPDSSPAHEVSIYSRLINDYDIIYGIVEQRYQSCDTNDSKWLCAQDAENHSRESRGKQRFIDAIELSGSAIHIQGVGDSRENTGYVQ